MPIFFLRAEKFRSISEFFIAQLRQIDFTLSSFLEDVEDDVEALADNKLVTVRDDRDFTSFLDADEHTFRYNIGEQEQAIMDMFANYRDYHYYVNSVYMGRENGAFVRKIRSLATSLAEDEICALLEQYEKVAQ